MVIGVFGWSFNPVHNGHIGLAREVVRRGLADRVMMVVSPLNPLKENPDALIDDNLRMEMLRIACRPFPSLEASDIELSMPRPSYTIDTWDCFDKWKSHDEILRDFSPIVYPREGYAMPQGDSQATPLRANLLPVSSTEIRRMLKQGKPVNNLVPRGVLDYIQAHSLYGIPSRRHACDSHQPK